MCLCVCAGRGKFLAHVLVIWGELLNDLHLFSDL